MPKEIAHLTLAERVLEAMEGTDLGKTIISHKGLYLYGSVMLDTPFYAPHTGDGEAFIEKGMQAHGIPPCNTLSPYARLAGLYDTTPSPELLALISGAVVHMISDITFHPFVVYFSGDNLSRHYKLETLLDCHFYKTSHHKISARVSSVLDMVTTTKKALSIWVAAFFETSPNLKKTVEKTLKRHARIQNLFFKRWAYHLYCVMTLFKPTHRNHNKHLFYPRRMMCNTPFFSGSFTYRHPVTGETKKTSIDKLTDDTTRKSIEILSAIHKSSRGKRLETYFHSLSPQSLETGLEITNTNEKRFHDLTKSIDRLVFEKP